MITAFCFFASESIWFDTAPLELDLTLMDEAAVAV